MLYNQPYGKPAEVVWGDTPYINGDPSTGQAGSIPPAASIEYPQREIVNLIKDAALVVPGNSDLHQLAKSIQSTLLYSDDDAGTANAYQVTQTPAPTAYFKYMTVVAKIANSNTGASVLNVNALGPKPIRHPADNSELAAGELKQNAIACFVFDGTIFHLVWTSGGVSSSGGSGGTIYLQKPTVFYVNGTTGDDTAYDGTSATVVAGTIHGPFKTLQKPSNVINNYNLNGFNVTVNVADGAYNYWVLPSPSGAGSVSWIGNHANPAAVSVSTLNRTACSGSQTGQQIIDGFKLSSPQGGNWTVYNDPLCCFYLSGNQSTVSFSSMEFGGSPGAMVSVGRSAWCQFSSAPAAYVISGSSPGDPEWIGAMFYTFNGGNIGFPTQNPTTITISVPITIQYGFVVSSISGCTQVFANFVNPGNVTGPKYQASQNGVINSSGSGVNYYPGTVAGTLSSGGQYA
jgi:hypothetical protein